MNRRQLVVMFHPKDGCDKKIEKALS